MKEWTNGPLWILSTAALPMAGLLAFVLLSRRAHPFVPSARVREAGSSIFLSAFLMEYAYWALELPLSYCVRWRVPPTVVSLAGVLVVSIGCALVAAGYFGLAGTLVLVGSLSDMLDGAVARRLGRCSPAGQFVDAMVDRYADVVLLIGVGMYYRDRAACLCLILATLLGYVTVSYARAKAEALGVCDVPRGAMRRAERTVYLGFAILLAPLVARLLEPAAPRPRYDLVLATCALIATVCHLSTAQMMRFTVLRLRTR